LRQVWEPQGEGFAFTPYKDPNGQWHEASLRFPSTGLIVPQVGDVYFCPNLFRGQHRRQGDVQRGCWLYADLDEADPNSISPKPTIAWESSPGRFQALWRLDKRIPPKLLNELNKRLTYKVGADKGGWDLTQVLRVPGTRNHKYEEEPIVKVMWADGKTYPLTKMKRYLKEVDIAPADSPPDDLKLPNLSPKEIYDKHRTAITGRTKRLLVQKEVVEGERSDRLWELEHLLLDAGLAPEEVLILVRNSAWNKYRGRGDEVRRLWTEIQKAVRVKTSLEVGEGTRPTFNLAPTGWEHHDFFMETELPPPSWMVEDIWSDQGHGILGGEPKGMKSLLATDLAVSVASGTKFLNHFPCGAPGPVLMIQEENSPWMMQDRIRKIENSRGLLGSASIDGKTLSIKAGGNVHLELLNNSGFDLSHPQHLEALERKVQVVRPKLVILDPLYLMLGDADENKSSDIRGMLQWLLHLKYRYAVGIMIVHHYSKGSKDAGRTGGARLLGAQALHGWVESALYVEKTETAGQIKVEREFRSFPPRSKLEITIEAGEPGDDWYEPKVVEKNTIRSNLADVLEKQPLTILDIAKRLGKSRQSVEKIVKKEMKAGVLGAKKVPGKTKPRTVIYVK